MTKINGGTLRESAMALAFSAPQRPQLKLTLVDGRDATLSTSTTQVGQQ